MRWWRLLSLGVMVWLVVAPGALAGALAEDVRIGWISELTGAWTFWGTGTTQGAQLAVNEINAAGGSRGRKFQMVVVDDATNPAQAVAAARRLDAQQRVHLLSGPTNSDVALAVYKYAEENGIPYVVPVAAFPSLTRPGTKWTFRMEPDAVGWGYAIINFIARNKPSARVAFLFSDAALFRAIRAGLNYQAQRQGVAVLHDIVFPVGATDATVQVAQVRRSNPDYVVTAGAGSFDITLTKQLLAVGFRPDQIIHPFGNISQIVSWGPESVGSYFGTFFDPALAEQRQEVARFIEAYRSAYKATPSYTENFGYVTMYAIKEALDSIQGPLTRKRIRDALRALNTVERTTGVPIRFDANGARVEYYYIMQITRVDTARNNYGARQVFYIEWDPEVLPVYKLAP